MSGLLHLKIFTSSPGDVQDERELARKLVKEELPVDPFLRNRLTLDAVTWDDPAAGVPMLATMTPQEAVNRGLGRPADCDITIVILWSRMGSPLPRGRFLKDNGEPYRSGTEWEFEDVRRAGREVLVYRRAEKVLLDDEAPDFEERREQKRRVRSFFDAFVDPDGSCNTAARTYATPSEFKQRLALGLKALIAPRLTAPVAVDSAPPRTSWRGSPYPGLRAFTEIETAIFFGRDREADELLSRLRDPNCRFLTIIGDSGTGKSSLLHAGLLPRLRAGALPGSDKWRFAAFTPARQMGDPILSLSTALRDALPAATRPAPRSRSNDLAHDEASFRRSVAQILAGASQTAELILVVDQFEELFALECQEPFVGLLARAAATPRVRILATIRADFYPQAARDHTLAALLRGGSFPLAAPKHSALRDMIRRPAECAGASIPDDLVDGVLDDAGAHPGALPLVAFALAELWPEDATPEPTLAAYERIGRLRGAIGRRARALGLDDASEPALGRLFAAVVQVSADGIATRRRAVRSQLSDAEVSGLVSALVEERFLLAGDEPSCPTVELAHEALLASWPALQAWLERRGPHLRARRELVEALARWRRADESDQELIPPGSRLREAEELLHSAPDLLDDAGLRTFIERSLDRAARIDHEAQGALRREALRLAQLANEQIRAGDAVTGMLLGLEAMDRVCLVRDEAPLAPAATALYAGALAQQELQVLRGHEAPVLSAVFSPDGARLLTGSEDDTARLWDAASGRKLLALRGHEDLVNSAVFSPDSVRLLTASEDRTARLWDAASGRELLALCGHEGGVNSAVFSPDGAHVITASDDQTARLWPLFDSIEALIATVRSRLPRGLGPDQRRRFYLPET